MRIVPADFLKKSDDSPLKPLRVLHLRTAKFIEPLAKNRHCLRVEVRGCVKGPVVIGAKIHNDNIGRVCRKIKRIVSMRQDILPAACDTTDLLIETRKDTVRIILIIRHNTPAALGDTAEPGIKDVSCHPGVIVLYPEVGADPVLLHLGAAAALPAGDAVAYKLNGQAGFRGSSDLSLILETVQGQKAGMIIRNHLDLTEKADPVHNAGIQSLEQVDPVFTAMKGHAKQEETVKLH